MRIGKGEAAKVLGRLPADFRSDPGMLVVPCERGQGLAMVADRLAWVGVGSSGQRDRHAVALTATVADIARVLWNRIDILDRQELTVDLADGRQVTVAPLDQAAWASIRTRLEESGLLSASATIGERMGGFLPADPRAGQSAIVFVDSDRITWRGRQYLVDGSISARFGYRPGTSTAGGLLRGYALQDLFTRRSPNGMEPYVRIEADGWQIDTAIGARDPSYAMGLVERINDLGRRARPVA